METLYWLLAIICFFLAAILLFQNVKANKWLASYLLFLTSYLGLIILDAQTFYISPILYFLLLPIIFLPGPLLLGFIGNISTRRLIHAKDFAPCLLPILIVLVASDQISDKSIFEMAEQQDYQNAGYTSLFNLVSAAAGFQMLSYLAASFWLIIRLKKDWLSYQSNTLPRNWFRMTQVISFMIVVTVLQVISAFMHPSGNELSIGDISFILITLFFIYQSFLTIYQGLKKQEVIFIQHPLSYGSVKHSVESDEYAKLGIPIKERIMEDKLFLDNDLSLAILSEQLDITPHKLSEIINKGFNQTFYNFINDLRVQFAVKDLRDNPKKSITTVLFDAGFTTKSTFYGHFKKHYGCTPTQYRKKLDQSVDKPEKGS